MVERLFPLNSVFLSAFFIVYGSSCHQWFFSSPFPSFIPLRTRSSVTWRLRWQMAPAAAAPRLTARPPTTTAALHPCRPAQQMMTARPIWLSTTCPRTWPRKSSAVCLAASARLNPANWFETRSQVPIAQRAIWIYLVWDASERLWQSNLSTVLPCFQVFVFPRLVQF